MPWPYWWQPYPDFFMRYIGILQGYAPSAVSSYIRSVDHNAAVGGASNSQHLVGTAVDLVPLAGGSMQLIEYVAKTMGFGYVLNEGDHVHVQLYPAGTIPQWVYDSVATVGA